MRRYYECENDYCNHKWFDNSKLLTSACPFCGCKFVKIEELPDLITPCKSLKRKKHKH